MNGRAVFLLCAMAIATVLLSKAGAQPGMEKDDLRVNLTDGEAPTTSQPLPQEVTSTKVVNVSSPESHPSECIRSLFDLRQAYFGLKTAPGSMPRENTIFSFYPIHAVKYTSLALFYEYSTEEDEGRPASISLNSEECCNPENTSSCMVFFRHRSYLYRALYAPLIFLYAFPTVPTKLGESSWFNKRICRFGVRQLCWKVPHFCASSERVGGQNDYALLKAFTAEFPHLVLSANEGPIQVGAVDHYDPYKFWDRDKLDASTSEEKLAIHSVVLSVFIMTIPLFLLAMDTYSTSVSTLLIKSRFAANCLYMAMFQSWFWVLVFIFNTIQILQTLLHTAQSSEKYLHDLLMPDVVLCFTLFGVEVAVILIELPFICSYFWKSPVVHDVYVNKSGLLKLRKGAESLGWTGIVIFCQAFSVIMCYMVMFLFIDPLYTIVRAGITVLVLLFIAVFTLYCGLFCANCCSCANRRSRVSYSCQKCHKYFLVAMVLLVAGCISYLAGQSLPQPFKDRGDMMVTGVLSSVGSSAMLALFGYICKKLIWNRITQEVQEFDKGTQNHGESEEFPSSSMRGDMPMLTLSTEQCNDASH